MSQYIVIAHRKDGRKPRIHLETNNEGFARAVAYKYLSDTQCDVYVFDTSTYECVLDLIHTPDGIAFP